MTTTIHVGDCIEVMRGMEAGSVQMCMTSPPYYKLRDYGTAEWEGGDAGCDHKDKSRHQSQGASSQRVGRSNVEAQRNDNFRSVCPDCGAKRIDRQIGLEESPDCGQREALVLRADLTEEERALVITRLCELGLL